MTAEGTAVVCSGCGYRAPADEPYPFQCPGASSGDDIDHLMVRVLDPEHVSFPWDGDPNPFTRFRRLFHAYHLGLRHGMLDDEYVDLVRDLDRRVAKVDGQGFSTTPFSRADELSERAGFAPEGGIWVKDETGNVSGSHKARHLMGVMIHLLTMEWLSLAPSDRRPDLAISSCGNAALAAAVVANAAGWPLQVFVPAWADPAVLDRLVSLGARVTTCERRPGVSGDPAYHALRRAMDEGALPFSTQGPDNGLTIEGGETLAYELVTDLAAEDRAMDRLVIQVGGGALASSCIRGFEDAALLEAPVRLPRIHAVQTEGAHPLERAFRLVRERAGAEPGPSAVVDAMAYARTHRSGFMWPWESEPHSIATGIVDDETYDWAAVVGGMLATDGGPVLASEDRLREANDLARRTTGIDVDPTGSAGLAGVLSLLEEDAIGPAERIAVLFTGVRR
ncbi:MAG TPA: pyridoxal-phosphate dependent enzyme [Actinomycetota bacterium]|nr:pyridoxal-phosphate dependent enzyme [Actinomycetota bacterium]